MVSSFKKVLINALLSSEVSNHRNTNICCNRLNLSVMTDGGYINDYRMVDISVMTDGGYISDDRRWIYQ